MKVSIPHCPENCETWHSPYHIAGLMSVSRGTVYRLMNDGSLTYKDTQHDRRINHREVDRFMNDDANCKAMNNQFENLN